MQRLCERPGCSEPASVAYGMRAEDLVFWLDTLRQADPESDLEPGGRGVLCRRHADSMVVPRDWTLDDLRDPDLHLFRPPAADESAPRRGRRRAAAGGDNTEQLALGVDEQVDARPPPAGGDAGEEPAADPAPVTAADRPADRRVEQPVEQPVGEPESEPVEPWTPTFDDEDDLDGLLSASSPLLARAFRGADRAKDS